MAIRTNEELMNLVRTALGESPDDNGLSLLGDVQDTLNARGDVQAAIAENDKKWRKKMADRFVNGGKDDNQDENQNDGQSNNDQLTYESLFETKQ